MPLGVVCVGMSSVVIIIFVKESAVSVSERCSCFCLSSSGNRISRLYIHPFTSFVTNKINLECRSGNLPLSSVMLSSEFHVDTIFVYLHTFRLQR